MHGINTNLKKNILSQGCTTGIDMIFAGIYKNELSVINVFPSIQCFCLNISEMNRIESTSYSVLITRGISRYMRADHIIYNYSGGLSTATIALIHQY